VPLGGTLRLRDRDSLFVERPFDYSMEPSHFEQVPANLVAAILDQKEKK